MTALLEYLDLFLQTVSDKSGGGGGGGGGHGPPSLPPMLEISVGIFVNATILASTSVGTLATTFTFALVGAPDVSATYSSCKIKSFIYRHS